MSNMYLLLYTYFSFRNFNISFPKMKKSYEILRIYRGRRGRDRMVVGLTFTCAISSYHHYRCEFESH